MPNINLDDAYILEETGAEVDKVTGLFTKDEGTTSGEKAFAQLNIGTAGSNRNLLDNPWFTVNQRSFTSTSGAAYFADRWQVSGNTYTLTRRTTGITMQVDSGIGYLFQNMESAIYDFLDGKTVTYSFRFSDDTVISITFVWDKTKRNYSLEIPNDTRFQFWYGDAGQPCLRIFASSTGYDIDAIKLELGSVSTLANDAPPDYGTELAKCQRYFLRIAQKTSNAPMGFGVATSPTSALVTIPTPVTMRSSGTITISSSGSTTLRFSTSNVHVTSIAFRNISPNAVAITAIVSSGLTGNNAVMFMPDAGYILDISADL